MPAPSLRREVGRLVKKWRKLLGIGDQWRIEVRVKERPSEEDGDDAQAHIVVTPQYFHATMVLNAWQCEGVNLEEVVCHEMLHIVFKQVETIVESAMGERFAELGEQHLESVVERLSRCLVRLANG